MKGCRHALHQTHQASAILPRPSHIQCLYTRRKYESKGDHISTHAQGNWTPLLFPKEVPEGTRECAVCVPWNGSASCSGVTVNTLCTGTSGRSGRSAPTENSKVACELLNTV